MRNHIAKIATLSLLTFLAAAAFAQNNNNPNSKKNARTPPKDSSVTASPGENPEERVAPATTPADHAEPLSSKDGLSASPGQEPGGNPLAPQPPRQLPPWWLSDPIILGLIGALIFLGLALHVVHIVTQSRLRREFAGLSGAVQALSQRVSMADEADKRERAGASNELARRLNRHRQGIDQLAAQFDQVEQRVKASERSAAETSTAVALAAQMAGQPRVKQALDQSAGQIGEADRATAIKIVGQYNETLGANEARVKPLIQETSALAEKLNGRSNLHPELVNRVQGLRDQVVQFERWRADASERLSTLQRGSVSERYSAFRAGQRQLVEQFNTRAISIVDYVKAYAELMDRHFPAGADGPPSIAPSEHESDLKKIAAGVNDYLMDWFDQLSQLQAQVAQASIDTETADSLAQIQRAAKDVLGKFDIQPEEIQIGVTTFDRRLHDASLITQSPQYPANTVVGVQQFGFRKLSTGDVLRRPKVIVAGVGAG